MSPLPSRAALLLVAPVCLAIGCGPPSAPPAPPPAPNVTAQDIENNAGQSIVDVLQAKAPGLIVTQGANGGISIQIRGPSTYMGSNEPLFVIDDVPVEPGPGGALMGVNPYDIETIRVLKNPSDTAIYGVRGANGVIVIRTKRSNRR